MNPRLRRLKKSQQSGEGVGSSWELQLDVSKMPALEPVDVVLEMLISDPLPPSFWTDPRVAMTVDVPVEELVAWILLPAKTEFDRFRLLELDSTRSGAVIPIHPSAGVEKSQGEIIHWSLFAPEPGRVYECHWDWRK